MRMSQKGPLKLEMEFHVVLPGGVRIGSIKGPDYDKVSFCVDDGEALKFTLDSFDMTEMKNFLSYAQGWHYRMTYKEPERITAYQRVRDEMKVMCGMKGHAVRKLTWLAVDRGIPMADLNDVAKLTLSDLWSVEGIGKSTIKHIEEVLSKHGLSLRDDAVDP